MRSCSVLAIVCVIVVLLTGTILVKLQLSLKIKTMYDSQVDKVKNFSNIKVHNKCIDQQNFKDIRHVIDQRKEMDAGKYFFSDFIKQVKTYSHYGYTYRKDRVVVECYDDSFLDGKVELTIRTSTEKRLIKLVLCNLLESAALFWKPQYGPILFILDDKDAESIYFPNKLNSLGLPFKFRFVYERGPKNVNEFISVGRSLGKSYGYMLQLYSMFLMDLYTNTSIIAYTDSDVIMSKPIIAKDIQQNGKLVTKGLNNFHISWVRLWDQVTFNALGLPMVSDFMMYFPIYVYPSTIKNCREYIMKRVKASTFEEAFLKITTTFISPVSVIMSYAYYFERDLYDWHLDIGKVTLSSYNKRFKNSKHYLKQSDTLPFLQDTFHMKNFGPFLEPLICYLQLAVGMKDIAHCKQYEDRPNMQLVIFQGGRDAMGYWCQGEKELYVCFDLINNAYSQYAELYRQKKLTFDISRIELINSIAKKEYSVQCPSFKYVSFK